MPRRVDHQKRREQVTAIAADLVGVHGRSALTVRRVADAVGCSTTVVSHYFDDMSDLLHQTYAYAARRSRARIDAVLAADPTDLVGLAEAILPLDAERETEWRIWVAFWAEALASDAFATEQRRRTRMSTNRFRACLQALVAVGRLADDVDVGVAADRISALIRGIAVEAIFDPRRWTAIRQRTVLADEFASLGIAVEMRLDPVRRRAS